MLIAREERRYSVLNSVHHLDPHSSKQFVPTSASDCQSVISQSRARSVTSEVQLLGGSVLTMFSMGITPSTLQEKRSLFAMTVPKRTFVSFPEIYEFILSISRSSDVAQTQFCERLCLTRPNQYFNVSGSCWTWWGQFQGLKHPGP